MSWPCIPMSGSVSDPSRSVGCGFSNLCDVFLPHINIFVCIFPCIGLIARFFWLDMAEHIGGKKRDTKRIRSNSSDLWVFFMGQ